MFIELQTWLESDVLMFLYNANSSQLSGLVSGARGLCTLLEMGAGGKKVFIIQILINSTFRPHFYKSYLMHL